LEPEHARFTKGLLPGTDVTIFKNILAKKLAKKLAFFGSKQS
jgi:hypothetical protein